MARVVVVLLLLLTCAVAGRAAAGEARSAAPSPCRAPARVAPTILPVWARDGFSDPKPRMPFRLGKAGRIGAILWADPLRSPPPRNHTNKILWVSSAPVTAGSDLRIAAQRMSGTRRLGAPVFRRVMGGPGPSIVNLPRAGCWRLTLRWSRSVDSLDLTYVAR